MIYDCFIYNGEKDLLEIRLNESCLFGEPVMTIIVEANKTHTGLDKPLYYEQHKDEFSNFDIMYYVVDTMPEGTPKEREVYQRNKILDALKLLSPENNDKVIIGDIDEVPRARQVKLFKPEIQLASLLMDKYAYWLNCIEGEQSWDRARIMSWEYLKDKQPNDVRDSGYDFSIHHAGWHYSWVIDPITKLISFSHQELNTTENISRVARRENIWNDDKFNVIDINLSHPEYLYRNIDKFKHLIK